ncbi:PLD nuclease N-terminal domain-containing protein [Streptomyces sp. NBC_01476]|uniref:PLD nuclease N-terminal domain-containing protein n=1 Tax=Streptomyces sp. NBC_01476 TaxID=2903881 RepID=UPI002E2F527A|nr:PLD nuclease N-terminal domain-containing protein [Streptomyces sp. NBC_01476]
MLHYLPYLLLITLWIYALVDCLGTPQRDMRGPKLMWLVVILFFGEILVGPLAWLMLGKRRVAAAYPQSAYGYRRRAVPEPAAAGADRAVEEQPAPRFIAPDDNPEFLRSLSELIKQQRKDGTSPSGSPDSE